MQKDNYIYSVKFKDGSIADIESKTAIEAGILAAAEKIKNNQPYEIEKIYFPDGRSYIWLEFKKSHAWIYSTETKFSHD